jgi:hypothetical protein
MRLSSPMVHVLLLIWLLCWYCHSTYSFVSFVQLGYLILYLPRLALKSLSPQLVKSTPFCLEYLVFVLGGHLP